MDGIFIKNKTPILALLLLASGLYDVAVFGWMLIEVGFSAGEDSLVAVIFLVLGLALCALCVLALRVRRKMRLHIENGHVSGVLQFGKKLECDFSEIRFAEAGYGVLSIKLKNGKLYTITGLQNAMELCDCIRQGLDSRDETADRETLEREIRELTEKRKKQIARASFLIVLWFLDIFLTVMLTGKKEFAAFTGREWIIFGAMMCLLFGMVVLTFVFASRAGKLLSPLQEKRHYLRKLLLESEPLGMGKCRKIYADDGALIRVVIYGYPNAEDVYLTIEAIDRHLRLCCVYESPVYPNEEELMQGENLPRPTEGMRLVYSE